MSRRDSRDDADEEVVPRPAALIESLRSFGYSPATSVADLIDNSLSANARQIRVHFEWDGPNSWASVTDDGHGMTPSELREAMRAGSSNPLDERQPGDLGRFGLGLKTASFAQARSVTVLSRRAAETSVRRWDLDHVQATNRWALQKVPPQGVSLDGLLGAGDGTTVVWHKMDRLVDDRPAADEHARSSFFRTVDEVRAHLEMVFHRFIDEDGLELVVNSVRCRSWDPFLSSNKSTERLKDESLPVVVPGGAVQKLLVQPYILPHRSHLTPEEHRNAAGARGWNLQQGFYLYRARRLIVPGNWFDRSIKPEEHHKLARIRVEITQEMDGLWALDVRKSRARPPAELRREFQRIARATRERAEDVYRTRGRREVGQGGLRHKTVPVWRVASDGKTVSYAINREHPLVNQALEELPTASRRRLRTLLGLIERTVPLTHILSQGYRDEEKLGVPETMDDDLRAAARELFCHLLSEGLDSDNARAVIGRVQPFNDAPSLVDALEEEDCP